MKIKIFCASQDTIHRVMRQAIEWENICANHRAEKGFISRIYREPLKLTDWLKKAKESESTLIQRRQTNGQQVRENMLNIRNHQANAYQKYNELPPYTD